MYRRFKNREEAGQELSQALAHYKAKPDTFILALPRGGVPVAYEVAKTLSLPMDVWLVRKLGVPGHEELAMGAIALDGTYYINQEIANELGISRHLLDQVITKERAELNRRNILYRRNRPIPEIKGKTVIIIDDGLATGATMRAAIQSLRQMQAAYIVAAAPVGAEDTCRILTDVADEVICPHMPHPFYGVGQWYLNFSQTEDEDVQKIMEQTAKSAA